MKQLKEILYWLVAVIACTGFSVIAGLSVRLILGIEFHFDSLWIWLAAGLAFILVQVGGMYAIYRFRFLATELFAFGGLSFIFFAVSFVVLLIYAGLHLPLDKPTPFPHYNGGSTLPRALHSRETSRTPSRLEWR